MFAEMSDELLELKAQARGRKPAFFAMLVASCSCCCCCGGRRIESFED